MALTDAQKTDVRRFAGYSAVGDTNVGNDRDFAYGWVSPGVMQTLFHRLNTLLPTEETVLVSVYLTNLTSMEAAVASASDNLDTDQAAVWTHNKDEVRDRTRLLRQWQRQMCGFLGIPPGPALGQGGVSVMRG